MKLPIFKRDEFTNIIHTQVVRIIEYYRKKVK